MTIPRVAIVGRTNAGKSTLFNRLTETSKAIVSSIENTTRDQNRGLVHWKGWQCEVIDTGGLDTAAADPLNQAIQTQVTRAMQTADAIIFVVDGKCELLPQDKTISKLLQKSKKPVLLCINKVDTRRVSAVTLANFSSLPYPVSLCSAKNGSGTGELLDALFERIPQSPSPETASPTGILITLVGRPNVGKSSLFNALIGEDRVIISDLPHTTRDINDTELTYKDQLFTILDTAGIRKRSNYGRATTNPIERYSVSAAVETVDRADVVVLMLEAQLRISSQDKSLVDYAKTKGKSVIVVVNKWDLIPDKTPAIINQYRKYFTAQLDFAKHVPMVFISAKNNQRITNVLDIAKTVYTNRFRTLSQDQLNTILKRLLSKRPKQKQKLMKGQPKKLLVLNSFEQVGTNPPTFQIASPHPKNVAPALLNIIEQDIRRTADYDGVPIMLDVRTI